MKRRGGWIAASISTFFSEGRQSSTVGRSRCGMHGTYPASLGIPSRQETVARRVQKRGTMLAPSPRFPIPAARAGSIPHPAGGGLQAAIVRALAAHIEHVAGSEHVDELRVQLGEEVLRLDARSVSVCGSRVSA